jgi:hypothetical protein
MTALGSARGPAAARAPAYDNGSKLDGRSGASAPGWKLRGANGCSGWWVVITSSTRRPPGRGAGPAPVQHLHQAGVGSRTSAAAFAFEHHLV